MNIGGITFASSTSVSDRPRITLKKSIPAFVYAAAIRMASSGPSTTAIGALLVERHPHPDDEVVTDRGTDRGDHLERKSDPVLQRTAVLVLAMVERRRHELIEQMPAVGRDLDAVETTPPCNAARSRRSRARSAPDRAHRRPG